MTFYDLLLKTSRLHHNKMERSLIRGLLDAMVDYVAKLPEEEQAEALGRHVFDAHDHSTSYQDELLAKADMALVLLGEAGEDARVLPLDQDVMTLGRTAQMSFEEDAFMSPEHVRLEKRQGRLFAHDLESINGSYVRVLEPMELTDGDVFLLGRQVMRFHIAAPHDETKGHNVRRMGSPLPDAPKPRISQIGPAGEVLSTMLIEERGVVLGREPEAPSVEFGVYAFKEDRYQSSTHAKIHRRRGAWTLEDDDSSNGTWIKITERELADGDHLFIGTQLMRVVIRSTSSEEARS